MPNPSKVHAHLVDEERTGKTARLPRIGDRHVVSDDDHLDVEAHAPSLLGCEAEVEAIARVVLHDEEAPWRAGDREDRREHGIDTRRCEDLAAHRGCEHSVSDEADMRGLVSRAATGHDGHLGSVPVRPHDDLDRRKTIEATQRAVRESHLGVNRLGDDVLSFVDEVLHARAWCHDAAFFGARCMRGLVYPGPPQPSRALASGPGPLSPAFRGGDHSWFADLPNRERAAH